MSECKPESFVALAELEEALSLIRQSPAREGAVVQIVIRPETNERQIVNSCELSLEEGVVGDNWKRRGFSKGEAHPEMQINIMNARVIDAIAGMHLDKALAGDQFYVDLDLSKDNLPPGSRLSLGTAELEVTREPHLGCRKFSDRFGKDSVVFVNSTVGKSLNLRGINAKVVVAGTVNSGSVIKKLS